MFSSCNIVVGCVYRSPSRDIDVMEKLCRYTEDNVLHSKLILLGEFSLADLNWETLQQILPSSDKLSDLMLSHNISQVVTEATRVHGTTSNVLDLVFLSYHFPVEETKLELIDGISDHKIILRTVCTSPKRYNSISSAHHLPGVY